jgi:hypothetical protein
MESIQIALELMGFGLGGTFLSLILLYVAILVLRKVFKAKEENPQE